MLFVWNSLGLDYRQKRVVSSRQPKKSGTTKHQAQLSQPCLIWARKTLLFQGKQCLGFSRHVSMQVYNTVWDNAATMRALGSTNPTQYISSRSEENKWSLETKFPRASLPPWAVRVHATGNSTGGWCAQIVQQRLPWLCCRAVLELAGTLEEHIGHIITQHSLEILEQVNRNQFTLFRFKEKHYISLSFYQAYH